MKSEACFAVGLVLVHGVAAQAGPWGQCGGLAWTGPTSCAPGWHCQYQNDWYWQCLQGPGSTSAIPTTSSRIGIVSSTSSSLITSRTSTRLTSHSTATAHSQSTGSPSTAACTATFSPISASTWVEASNPGWNLGNTLDAIPNEGSWNNPPVVASTFDDIKAAGFKSVRIPVTYADHFTSGSPTWTVDPAWLQRVSDVVDMATSRGLYVLTNVHHDSWNWADITKPGANLTAIDAQFSALWLQIAATLRCKSSLVALEPINEPPANTVADGAQINTFNELFLAALASTGGFNSDRVVTLTGPTSDSLKTTQSFVPPANITNPWALQYHYYSPYDFVFGAWGKTIWGSDGDKQALATDLGIVRGNFTDVPLVIGEFSVSPINTEPAARWKWVDWFARTARELNTAIMIWDNGADNLDRAAKKWRDETSVKIMKNALTGVANALPDSTTDGGATSQMSSAFVFHRVGGEVGDETLPWLFNGNTLTNITTDTGSALVTGTDYDVSASAITLKAAFLGKYYSQSATPGVKENLTMSFSAGADIPVQLVIWDTPSLGSPTSIARAGSDLAIPVTYKGLKTVAAVKMTAEDGTYLFDDWTQWLGPLQQSRGTFNGQWNWDDGHVILTAATVQQVISLGKPTTFTFEFYPRLPGNSVNYTLSL